MAGAVDAASAPDVTPRDSRQVHAWGLIAAESVEVVERRLGHSSAAMTLDVDSHLRPDGDDRSRTVVDALLGALAHPPRRGGA